MEVLTEVILHGIPIPRDLENPLLDEAMDWLHVRLGEPHQVCETNLWFFLREPFGYRFFFKSPCKALLFKLTFGGK